MKKIFNLFVLVAMSLLFVQCEKEGGVGVHKKHEFVDLGLSVKWATCNIGAETSTDFGDYFAWGETSVKETYDWSTYKYCAGVKSSFTKYCSIESYGNEGFVDDKKELDAEDDVAMVTWGGKWRMPTRAELAELRRNCTWEWFTMNGVHGYLIRSKKNGNSIFLPAAGFVSGTNQVDVGEKGYYWSTALYTDAPFHAYIEKFEADKEDLDYCGRIYGLSVRPVCP
jgi:hypothetical protein